MVMYQHLSLPAIAKRFMSSPNLMIQSLMPPHNLLLLAVAGNKGVEAPPEARKVFLWPLLMKQSTINLVRELLLFDFNQTSSTR